MTGPEKAKIFMKACWHSADSRLLKSWALQVGWGHRRGKIVFLKNLHLHNQQANFNQNWCTVGKKKKKRNKN
jgi:hypothetical protein